MREQSSNLASQTQYKGVLSAKLAVSVGVRRVWRSRGAAQKSGAWSLQSVGELRRAEELGAQPSLPCRTDLRVRVRDVGRAGESSPASIERSEVIGLRDSLSIAEGRTGS